MPLLSVIVPTYNRAALLAEALKSALSQEFTDFEIVVVDDGSTDDTPAVLARFAEGLATGKLRVLHQANAGQGAARNRAIAEARGEYCMFLDSDDLLFPWSLAIVARTILEHARPSVMLGSEMRFESGRGIAAVASGPLQTSSWPDLYAYAAKHKLGPCGILVARTELLREVGGFVTERIVGEDADLMVRLGCAPGMVKVDDPPLYGYRMHAENFTLNYDPWYQGAHQFIRRYRQGAFPGGAARRGDARRQTALAVAYYSYIGLYHGARRKYLDLYWKTLAMQLRAANFSFVFTTPYFLVLSLMGRWPKRLPDGSTPRFGTAEMLASEAAYREK